jgi:hypothetical protein
MMTGMPSRHLPANSLRGVSAPPDDSVHAPQRRDVGTSGAPRASRMTEVAGPRIPFRPIDGRPLIEVEAPGGVRLDLHDVENWSPTSDVMIMWRAVTALVRPKGAS